MASLDTEQCSEEPSKASRDEMNEPKENIEQAAESPESHSAKKRKRKRKKKANKLASEVEGETEESYIDSLVKEIGELKVTKDDGKKAGGSAHKQKGGKHSAHNQRGDTHHAQNQRGDKHYGTPKAPSADHQTPVKETEYSDDRGQHSSHHKRSHHRRKKKNTEGEDEVVDGKGKEDSTPHKEDMKARTPNRHGSATRHTPAHKRRQYEKYWSLEDVSAGLKRGELIQGPLRISKRNYEMAWMSAPHGGRDIFLEGMVARNRALDGDIIAVSILPRNKWKVMKSEYEAYKLGLEKDGSTDGGSQDKESKKTETGDHKQGTPKDKHKHENIRVEDVPDGYLQQTAHVVYIIEKKHTRAASGHLKPFNHGKNGEEPDGLFSPTDNRLPRIRIPRDLCPPGFFDRPQDFANSLFVAHITEWSENSSLDNYYATGKISRSLGEAGEIEPETEGIFFEYGIDPGPFPDDALACLPKETPWSIPEDEIASRRNFRDECVFTIDPLTARDLDDALHVKRLPDGLIEVGVHIADVSYFVRPGTALDDIAQDRATSTYMVQTVVPMLPRRLCEELCSLNPDEDRLTFSVVWIMTDKGEIRSDWKGRGIIRSRVKMAYEHAQEMIDKPNKKWEPGELPPIAEGTDVDDISSCVRLLHKIARHLRRNRIENGALRLDQVKLAFDLDQETGMPLGYHVYQQRDSNKLIEEFMLLANMTVAHHIYNAFPEMALLRRHPKPHQKQIDDLLELCKNLGVQFKATSSKAIQISLAQFPMGSAKHEILVQLTMKPMKNAVYFSSGSLPEEEYGHYALSVPLYTHFTSPIRRYPDVVVHRLLAASLGLEPPIDKETMDVDAISIHCNDRKLAAKTAGELSGELFFAIFVRECGPLEEDGVVLSIMDQSFDVFVSSLGVTKRIYCKYCQGVKRYEPYNRKEHQQPEIKLIWATGTEKKPGKDLVQVLHIFTPVRVILTTEHQTEEKSKHLKVYARLRPPAEAPTADLVEGETQVEGDAVRKQLFQEEDKGARTARRGSSSSDVIVETESEEETPGPKGGAAMETDAAGQPECSGAGPSADGIEESEPSTHDDVIVTPESVEKNVQEKDIGGREDTPGETSEKDSLTSRDVAEAEVTEDPDPSKDNGEDPIGGLEKRLGTNSDDDVIVETEPDEEDK